MSQIDREMEQIERGPGSVMLFSAVGALATPLHVREPWLSQTWRALNAAALHAVDTILTWQERARMRHQLLMLDDRLLRDIGITRVEARTEAEKPFWQV